MILGKVTRVFCVAVMIMICLSGGFQAKAAENFEVQLDYNGYSLKNYEVSVVVNKDSSMDVKERITADFAQPKHGIYRTIPLAEKMLLNFENIKMRKNYLAKVSDISVRDAVTQEAIPYSLRTNGSSMIIQIGDSNATLIGKKTYELYYHYALKTSENASSNYLSYNLIGTGWDTSINNISFNIDMPAEIRANKLNFFSGLEGSNDKSSVQYSVKGNRISGSVGRILNPGEGLTVQLLLPEGYFQVKKDLWVSVEIFIFVILAGISILLWNIYGRNRRMRVSFLNAPPEQLNPAEISYVLNGSVSEKSVSAMILYWANLGFLHIVDEGKNILRLIKLREPDNALQLYEKQMFDKLFKGRETVVASELKEDFYTEVQAFQRAVKEKFEAPERLLFEDKSIYAIFGGYCISALIITVMTVQSFLFFSIGIGDFILTFFLSIMILLGSMLCSFLLGHVVDRLRIGFIKGFFIWVAFYVLILSLFALGVGNLMLQPYLYVIGSIAAGISVVAGAFSNRRTEYGMKLLEEVLSYRRYIAQEIDGEREKCSSEDILFRDFAYAFSFGLSKKWAASLGKIIKEPPTWYSAGQTVGFEPVYYMMYIERSMGGYESIMSSSDSSSGGGGSGGGAGGGGGGSW